MHDQQGQHCPCLQLSPYEHHHDVDRTSELSLLAGKFPSRVHLFVNRVAVSETPNEPNAVKQVGLIIQEFIKIFYQFTYLLNSLLVVVDKKLHREK